MTALTSRTALIALAAASLLLTACAPTEDAQSPTSATEPQDLGEFGGGKTDFAGIDFDLPCIAKAGEAGDTMAFKLRGSGAFEVAVSQPDTPSRQRAVVRIKIDDGERSETTASATAPTMVWTPEDKTAFDYTVTVINRSRTKTLCANLRIDAVETAPEPVPAEIVPPTARQTFAPDFDLSEASGPVTVAFFDADSTLRVSKVGSVTPKDAGDVMILPGVVTKLREAVARGELVVVVSNQGGVSKGFTTAEIAEGALVQTAALLAESGAQVHYFDFAPDFDDHRKPNSGMALTFEANLADTFGVEIDWDSSYMVGDAGWKRDQDIEPDGTPGEDFSNSDRGFAEGLGIPFSHPRDFFGWADLGVRNFHKPWHVQDFLEAHPDFDE